MWRTVSDASLVAKDMPEEIESIVEDGLVLVVLAGITEQCFAFVSSSTLCLSGEMDGLGGVL
jgi:hypothetical protein